MKRIVIIGPESTGKSTLCEQLASYYKTTWCPEYAREYLLDNGNEYNYDDLLNIAKGQLALEDKMVTEAKNSLYFIDTDMYVMKVWCEIVFDNCHAWILKQIAERKYDLYLLCNVDLPWVQDGLREYPNLEMRTRLFTVYKELLINSGVHWTTISGTYSARFEAAVDAINEAFDLPDN
jgi:NadR type nicotinamide-nucleotide adenylyltransferase